MLRRNRRNEIFKAAKASLVGPEREGQVAGPCAGVSGSGPKVAVCRANAFTLAPLQRGHYGSEILDPISTRVFRVFRIGVPGGHSPH